jgi:potassium-dependent mechanosensitive channel
LLALRAVIRKSLDTDLGPRFVAGALLVVALATLSPETYSQAQPARSRIQTSSASTAKPGQAAEGPTSATPQTASHPIPLPQIANRAEELDHLLRDISSQVTMRADFLDAERNAVSQAEEIRERTRQAWNLLAGAPTPMEMEDEQRYWRSRNQEYASHRKLLTERAAEIEEQIQVLAVQQAEWHATWDQIRDSPGIEAVADRIFQQLNKIQATREQVLQQLNLVLTLQNQISQQDQQISDVMVRIRQARERERGRLLQLDSPPLWKIRELRDQDQGAGSVFQRSFHRSFQTAESFFGAGKSVMSWFAVAYVLTLFGIIKLKNYVIRARTEVSAEALQLLNRPFSVALLVSLIGTIEFVASSPVAIALSVYLLYVIPVLRLLAPWVEPWLRTFIYVLVAFSAVEGLYLLVQLPPMMRREIYVLLVLLALVSFSWLAHSSRRPPLAMQGRSRRVLLVAIRGGLLLLFASLVCSIIGAVSLSQVLGLVTLVGPFLAIALYCGARALALILITILRTPWAGGLLEARAYSAERWGGRILAVAASLLWLRVMLRFFAAYGTVMDFASDLLRKPIGLERFHFTLGDALGLLLILLGGYALANAIKFFLKKVVLPKLPLRRGIPYAISTVTYYFLLLLVALSALFAAGVDLNKFTLLTGGLGVGLGFGLQNIVNNFVSGLILIFERPISIGDTVDVGGLVGVVRRIGARASTVVTFQGAEVIVPNSNLISNQVVNWTLSSQWRRVDVRLSVAYGTDPERVIKMLVGVAESHPGVLLARPPAAFFMGFGESALNFELRFWCADQDTWLQLQSDVTVAIAKALKEAGIEIPFPQRDLHVRSVDAPVAEALASNKARSTSGDVSARRAHW